MAASLIEAFVKKLQEVNSSLKLRPKGVLRVGNRAKDYLFDCWNKRMAVNILTQCCVTKSLDERKILQNNRLKPLKSELRVFYREIPKIVALFKSYGFSINWFFIFVDSENTRRQASLTVKKEIMNLYQNLAGGVGDILFYDWLDFLNSFGINKINPNQDVLLNFTNLVKKDAFRFEYERRLRREIIELNELDKADQDNLIWETKYRIAQMAEEAKVITESLFPEGLILIPSEEPERYDFFRILVPWFKELLVCLLTPNFWRLGE